MLSEVNHNAYLKLFSAEVELRTYYKNPIQRHFLLLSDFVFYIGVQMALPFLTDKKSGVMKHDRENIVCNAYQQLTTCKLEITPDSRKSVVVCLKTTTLQLGAGGETV